MRTRQQTRFLVQWEAGEYVAPISSENDDLKMFSKGASKLSVDNENDGSINSTNDGPPQRKKRAVAKSKPLEAKAHNRIKGKLSGVFALPVELFMEIIQYLPLPDVLSLSHLNKFFYGMLMTRSATTSHVWCAAVNNVPGLPPCPEDLCEPQYATLIYSKHCTMCGASIVRPMDPYLNIRLCKNCTEEHVTRVDEIPGDLQMLIHTSPVTRLTGYLYEGPTCLVRDKVEFDEWCLDLRLGRLTGFMSKQARESAIEKRVAATRARYAYARKMEEFLKNMAQTRTKQIDQLKTQRRQDIKRRLEEAGWNEPDWTFPYFVAPKWASLVEAPQILTDRAWQKLYPSLIPYLEKNRQSHTEGSIIVRKGKRLRRMRRLLLAIRNDGDLFGVEDQSAREEAESGNPPTNATTDNSPASSNNEADSVVDGEDSDDDSGVETLNPSAPIVPPLGVRPPFPPMVDLLKWPIISELLEVDTDADTMQAQFEESKNEIEDQIRSWGASVEKELVDMLKAGSGDDFKDRDQNTDPSSEEPLLQLESETAPEGSLIDRPSPSTRFLLRADSVFRVSEDIVAPLPLYFPEMFSILQDRPDGYCTFAFWKGEYKPKHGYTWDSSEVIYYPEGCIAAKALLRQLGREDATQYELQALGARFTCGSCGDDWLRTWNEMVQHYAETIVHAGIAKKAKASIKKQIKYKNAHRLDFLFKSKTKGKPLVVLHSEERVKILSSRCQDGERLVKCKLCKQLGIDFQSPRYAMREHVRTVHSVKPPRAKHYKRTLDVRRRTQVGDPTGIVSDSTEATDPGIVDKIMSRSWNPGAVVFWSRHGPHSRIHPGWDREDF